MSSVAGPPARAAARNVSAMRVSAIKEMAMRSARVPGAASLAWGLPSFRTPEHVRAAVEQALNDDPDAGKYALPDGLPRLRELVARSHLERTGRQVDADRNVMITAGNMQAMSLVLHALLDPGDEVIVTDPGFASHVQQIRLCGGTPVYWAMDEARGWSLDVNALPGLITARTKALVLVSPSNPTGRILDEDSLRRACDIARRHGIRVLLDDPYSHFCFENRARWFNPASVPELSQHVVYMYTFSKAHAMSGWRLGYMVLDEALKHEVLKVHDATLICAPRIAQIAGIAVLSQPQQHVREFEAALARRRDLICARLDAMPHLFSYARPQGAYYVFPRILAPHRDSVSFALEMLATARVALTPGSAFGPLGEHHVRMAFCVDEPTIETAFDRMLQRHPA